MRKVISPLLRAWSVQPFALVALVIVMAAALMAALTLGNYSLPALGAVFGGVAATVSTSSAWSKFFKHFGWFLVLSCSALLLRDWIPAAPVALSAPAHPSAAVSTLVISASAASAASSAASGIEDVVQVPVGIHGGSSIELRRTPPNHVGDAADHMQEQLREVKEGINQTVTVWSILIAVLAIVLSFITSWVIGIARDAKDQVSQLSEATRLSERVVNLQRELDRQSLLHRVNRTLEATPDNQLGNLHRQFLVQLRRALISAQLLEDPFSVDQGSRLLKSSLQKISYGLEKYPMELRSQEITTVMQACLSWFVSQYQLVQTLPHLRGEEGEKVLNILVMWVHLLRRG